MNRDQIHVQRLHKFLPTLRRIAGWSSVTFSEMLGVSRATMVNIENPSTGKLTMIQYLAIRYLLREEVEENGNEVLGKMVSLLVDRDDITEEEREEYSRVVSDTVKERGLASGIEEIKKTATELFIKRFGSTPISAIPQEKMARGGAAVEAMLGCATESEKKGGV